MKKEYYMQKKARRSQKKKKTCKDTRYYIQEVRESINNEMESLNVNPQAHDQSNKVPTKKD